MSVDLSGFWTMILVPSSTPPSFTVTRISSGLTN